MFDTITKKFSQVVSSLFDTKKFTPQLLEDTLLQIRSTLLEADVPLAVVTDFVQAVKQEAVGKKILAHLKPAEQLVTIMKDKLVLFLSAPKPLSFVIKKPTVIIALGLQGAGKTTSLAKLASYIKRQFNKKILLSSVDFQRPAALDQLAQLAHQIDIDFYRPSTTHVQKANTEIHHYFQAHAYDVLAVDTAGRLDTNQTLMQELHDIKQYLNPQYTFFVMDGMTGQESLKVARTFDDQVGFDAAIITKMDSDSRAGVAFAFAYALKKPIQFIADGEKIDDFGLFDPQRIAGLLIGMGDLHTLSERAAQKIKQADQQEAEQSLRKGKLTLADFAKQLEMMQQLGSLSSLLKYLPGGFGAQFSPTALQKGEVEMKKFRAIMSSMSKKELVEGRLRAPFRKKQVAVGAGVQLREVDSLFERFEQAQQYVKLFKKNGFF